MVVTDENMDVKEAQTSFPKPKLVCEEYSQMCRCSEVEERIKKADARIIESELEIEKISREYKTLEAKFEELETKKSAVEDEVKMLRTRNMEIIGQSSCVERCGERQKQGGVVDLTEEDEEEDKVVQLMIENKVLECEKKKAECEVVVWKEKCRELELCVLQADDSTVSRSEEQPLKHVVRSKKGPDEEKRFDQLLASKRAVDSGNVRANSNAPGNPYVNTPVKHAAPFIGWKGLDKLGSEEECSRRVRKRLSYGEQIPSKKMSQTPGGVNPACRNVINICDSDDGLDFSAVQMATPHDHGDGNQDIKNENTSENTLNRVIYQNYEDTDPCEENIPCISTPKRKRAANVVSSDIESDEDDNVPICKLKRIHLQQSSSVNASSHMKSSKTETPLKSDVRAAVNPSRRRLVRQCAGKHKAGNNGSPSETIETKYERGIPATDDVEDSVSDEAGSDNEGESLSGFIVESSDSYVGYDASSQSEDKSDGNVDFNEILSRLRRSKHHKINWEFEADMLAAFGKDPELCMKAVCALYRQQTCKEKASKETLLDNNRGFSKFDGSRGSALAEFLTGGDPLGDLQKSVEELQEHDSMAVELCRTLATRYSKQLFQIYKNGEDPLFCPS